MLASRVTFYDQSGREVAGHRHRNPDGSLGGFVAETATVPASAHVDRTSQVGPGMVLGADAFIGPNCIVEADDPSSWKYIKRNRTAGR